MGEPPLKRKVIKSEKKKNLHNTYEIILSQKILKQKRHNLEFIKLLKVY